MTTDGPIGTDPRFRWRLIVAASLVAGWLGVLLTLAVVSANPVTVNREQILTSDSVVVGLASGSGASGQWLQVESVLAGHEPPARLRVSGLPEATGTRATRLVVPLRRVNGGYEVTPTPEALKGNRLVYPESPETLDAVTKILSTGAERPYD